MSPAAEPEVQDENDIAAIHARIMVSSIIDT